MTWLLLIAAGSLAGLIAGLLGLGGGIITVPALIFLLPMFGVSDVIVVHMAIIVSLLTILPTAVVSGYSHHQKDAVDWLRIRNLAVWVVMGATLAIVLLPSFSRTFLQFFFASFLVLIATKMFFGRAGNSEAEKPKRAWSLLGFVIGFIASLLGVGGGTMSVPYLLWQGVPMRVAVGTSSVIGLLIAVSTAITIVLFSSLPFTLKDIISYVIILSVFAMMFAVVGSRLAHTLPVLLLRKIFALILIVVAISLFI